MKQLGLLMHFNNSKATIVDSKRELDRLRDTLQDIVEFGCICHEYKKKDAYVALQGCPACMADKVLSVAPYEIREAELYGDVFSNIPIALALK